MDRILGALFGSAKSGLVLYLTLAVILMAKSQISNAVPQLADALDNSRVAQAVSQYNLLESQRAHDLAPTEVRALAKIMRLAGDPAIAERLKTDPEAQEKAGPLSDTGLSGRDTAASLIGVQSEADGWAQSQPV